MNRKLKNAVRNLTDGTEIPERVQRLFEVSSISVPCWEEFMLWDNFKEVTTVRGSNLSQITAGGAPVNTQISVCCLTTNLKFPWSIKFTSNIRVDIGIWRGDDVIKAWQNGDPPYTTGFLANIAIGNNHEALLALNKSIYVRANAINSTTVGYNGTPGYTNINWSFETPLVNGVYCYGLRQSIQDNIEVWNGYQWQSLPFGFFSGIFKNDDPRYVGIFNSSNISANINLINNH